jgi:hypothetical protein
MLGRLIVDAQTSSAVKTPDKHVNSLYRTVTIEAQARPHIRHLVYGFGMVLPLRGKNVTVRF